MTSAADFDETALILALKKGDRAAFIKLYDHYHPLLYHYILRFVKIPELAEDAMQEVFLKVWEIRERIDPDLSFNAYLYRISRNKVFKLMKKIVATDILRLRAMLEIQHAADDTDNKIRWQQYETLLNTAINQLPPQRQRVFRLCREQGKSYDEAAFELGISRNTVKEHMTLSIRFVKEYVQRHGDIILTAILFFR